MERRARGRRQSRRSSRVCAELHERFEAFCRRSLFDVSLVVLFLDAIYLPVRRSGPKEGVICAWGDHRERPASTGFRAAGDAGDQAQDWRRSAVGPRPLVGSRPPGCVVADGAAGMPRRSRRSGRAPIASPAPSHRLRSRWPSSRSSEQDRIRFNYWAALTDATSVQLTASSASRSVISELEHAGYDSAARCRPTTSTRWSCTCATDRSDTVERWRSSEPGLHTQRLDVAHREPANEPAETARLASGPRSRTQGNSGTASPARLAACHSCLRRCSICCFSHAGKAGAEPVRSRRRLAPTRSTASSTSKPTPTPSTRKSTAASSRSYPIKQPNQQPSHCIIGALSSPSPPLRRTPRNRYDPPIQAPTRQTHERDHHHPLRL